MTLTQMINNNYSDHQVDIRSLIKEDNGTMTETNKSLLLRQKNLGIRVLLWCRFLMLQ